MSKITWDDILPNKITNQLKKCEFEKPSAIQEEIFSKPGSTSLAIHSRSGTGVTMSCILEGIRRLLSSNQSESVSRVIHCVCASGAGAKSILRNTELFARLYFLEDLGISPAKYCFLLFPFLANECDDFPFFPTHLWFFFV